VSPWGSAAGNERDGRETRSVFGPRLSILFEGENSLLVSSLSLVEGAQRAWPWIPIEITPGDFSVQMNRPVNSPAEGSLPIPPLRLWPSGLKILFPPLETTPKAIWPIRFPVEYLLAAMADDPASSGAHAQLLARFCEHCREAKDHRRWTSLLRLPSPEGASVASRLEQLCRENLLRKTLAWPLLDMAVLTNWKLLSGNRHRETFGAALTARLTRVSPEFARWIGEKLPTDGRETSFYQYLRRRGLQFERGHLTAGESRALAGREAASLVSFSKALEKR
jgi:hypothetical protein